MSGSYTVAELRDYDRSDTDEMLDWCAGEIERLRKERDELVGAIDELGNHLFGLPWNGRSWRDAKAEWWQRCVRAVKAAEAAKERNP